MPRSAIMVLYSLARRLMARGHVSDTDAVPLVLGTVFFGFGHLLAITALFSPRPPAAWWARTALVTIWSAVLVWFFAGVALE